jgi:hypothetical protein
MVDPGASIDRAVIGRFAPPIRPGVVAPMAIGLQRLDRKIVVQTQDTKGRNDVLAKILVLVIAPDQHQVRVELVERGTDRAKVVGHARAVTLRGRVALIVSEFGHEFGQFARSL